MISKFTSTLFTQFISLEFDIKNDAYLFCVHKYAFVISVLLLITLNICNWSIRYHLGRMHAKSGLRIKLQKGILEGNKVMFRSLWSVLHFGSMFMLPV